MGPLDNRVYLDLAALECCEAARRTRMDVMAARYEYLISGDHAAGRKVVTDALAASGYVAQSTDAGQTRFSRGSASKTTMLGVFAGQDFLVACLLGFGSTPDGYLVARMERAVTIGELKGGWLGRSKTAREFDETVADVRSAAERAGVLHGHGEPGS